MGGEERNPDCPFYLTPIVDVVIGFWCCVIDDV
jgi:hypothetical protein